MEPDQIAEFVSRDKHKLVAENVAGIHVKDGYKITMKRGTVIFATDVQVDQKNPELVWVGQGTPGQYRKRAGKKRNADMKPHGWAAVVQPQKVAQGTPGYPIFYVKGSGGIMYKYPKIITMNIHNIDSIERT